MSRRPLILFMAGLMLVACLGWALPGRAGSSAQAKLVAEAAQRAFTLHSAAHAAGREKAMAVYFWSTRWLDAAGRTTKELAAHEARMQTLRAAVDKKVNAGLASVAESAAARFFVAEARLWRSRPRR